MRVVVYAEGSREDSGSRVALPLPGDALPEAALGPAHVLVRRCLVELVPMSEVRFDVPLRTRGRRARGSDLLHGPTVRRLLTWATPMAKPDLAVVIVDADGEANRHVALRHILSSRREPQPPAVIGVAVQEFEAWLIADEAALRQHLGFAGDP